MLGCTHLLLLLLLQSSRHSSSHASIDTACWVERVCCTCFYLLQSMRQQGVPSACLAPWVRRGCPGHRWRHYTCMTRWVGQWVHGSRKGQGEWAVGGSVGQWVQVRWRERGRRERHLRDGFQSSGWLILCWSQCLTHVSRGHETVWGAVHEQHMWLFITVQQQMNLASSSAKHLRAEVGLFSGHDCPAGGPPGSSSCCPAQRRGASAGCRT
jgi:hypothetical protein